MPSPPTCSAPNRAIARGRAGAIGAYRDIEVRRSPTDLSPGRNLRPRRGEFGDLGPRFRQRSLHVDDTQVPVLAPGTGKTKTGRLCPRLRGGRLYVREERAFAGSRPPAALFCYSPDRKGEHPRTHLKDVRGDIHTDGGACPRVGPRPDPWAGFNGLFAGGRVVEAACWAHVRRKFFDVHAATASPIAKEALDRIGQHYAVEKTSGRRSRIAARIAGPRSSSAGTKSRRRQAMISEVRPGALSGRRPRRRSVGGDPLPHVLSSRKPVRRILRWKEPACAIPWA
jgi:hypothetical protein